MITTIAGALAITLALALAPQVNADTLYVGGTGSDSRATKPTDLSWLDHGSIATIATQVGYPATVPFDPSIAQGADNLELAIRGTPGPRQVVGASQGAVVTNEVKRRLAADPDAPRDITFVQVADPTSRYGIMGRNPGVHIPLIDLTFVRAQPSPYGTTVIIRQYDGAADWPARQGNLLADLNAIAGFVYLHPHYGDVTLDGVVPIVDGNTTYYRVATANLPLLQPLRDMGVDERLVRALERRLKPQVDRGYVERGTKVPSPMKAAPQSVTGHQKPKHKRPSCARLVVCAR